MDTTTTVTEPLIALDSPMRATRIFAGITPESVAQSDEAVTAPELRLLVLAPTRPALNNTEVAAALDVHLSNAGRTCDRLVQAALLSRRESPTDRRRVELSLTRRGERLLATVFAHRQAAFNRCRAGPAGPGPGCLHPPRRGAHRTPANPAMTINEPEVLTSDSPTSEQTHKDARRGTGSASQQFVRGREIGEPGRIITIPSPELRQDVRLAVLSATDPAEQAHMIQHLVCEMTDQMLLTGGIGGKVLSVLRLINAAADHLDWVNQSQRPSRQRKPIHGTEEHGHGEANMKRSF